MAGMREKIVKGIFSSWKTPPKVEPLPLEEETIQEELTQDEVVAHVLECFEYAKRERAPFELQWRLNMNFLLGNQYCDIDPMTNEIYEYEKLYDWQERRAYNHIAPIVETRQAQLAKVRPSMTVRPATSDFSDVSAAKVSTSVVKAAQRKLRMSEEIYKATGWSEVCGTVLYKSGWDPKSGQVIGIIDGDAIAEGDVSNYVTPAFEFFPESNYAQDVKSNRWIIHAKAYHEDDAEEMFGRRIDGEDLPVFSLSSSSIGHGGFGETAQVPMVTEVTKQHQVWVIEYQEKPSRKYPEGRLIILAGKELMYYDVLPYINMEDKKRGYTFDRQVCIENPGCFWGISVIERLIPIQRDYNAIQNRRREYLNRIALGIVDVEKGAYDDLDIENEGLSPGKILVRNKGFEAARPLSFGTESLAEFDRAAKDLVNEFILISGVSELSRNSQAPTGAGSGIALEILKEQDNTRISLTAEHIRSCILSISQKWIRMYRQLAIGPRMDRLTGDNGDVMVAQWNRNDLTSDDVIPDTENEMNDTPAQRKQMVLDLLQTELFRDENGQISKSMKPKIFEMLQLGNWESGDDVQALQLKRAQREGMQLTEDREPEIREYDDDALHIEAHNAFRLSGDYEALLTNNPYMAQVMDDHVRMHEASIRFKTQAAMMEQQGMAMMSAPPPGGQQVV